MRDADGTRGVVVLFDRRRGVAMCTGTIVDVAEARNALHDAPRFRALVLTAGHCVASHDAADSQATPRFSIAIPARDEPITLPQSKLHPARVVASVYDAPVIDLSFALTRVAWIDDDWALLSFDSDEPLARIPVYDGDPETALTSGEEVAIATYHDAFYRRGRTIHLRRHEHPFAWEGVPRIAHQGGHSGAPLLVHGEVYGVFSGGATTSRARQCLTGDEWVTQLRFTSIKAIREALRARGLSLDARSLAGASTAPSHDFASK